MAVQTKRYEVIKLTTYRGAHAKVGSSVNVPVLDAKGTTILTGHSSWKEVGKVVKPPVKTTAEMPPLVPPAKTVVPSPAAAVPTLLPGEEADVEAEAGPAAELPPPIVPEIPAAAGPAETVKKPDSLV